MSTPNRWLAGAVAMGCLLVGAYMAINARQEARVREANELGLKGRYAEAVAKSKDVSSRPALTRALIVRGVAALALTRPAEAGSAFAHAVRNDPNNWELRKDYAIALARLGERRRAQAQMARALALNPRLALPRGFTR
jgi:Flp pilus assembly protein TadD